MFKSYLIPFFLSFALSIIFTPLVRRIAIVKGHVAKPREDRWHKKETALLGGIAIFIAFIVTYAIFVTPTIENIGTILCGCFIFGLGIIDDTLHIKPYSKLIGQIVVASLLVVFGVSIKIIPYPIIRTPLTIFWVLAIVNSFNLLDNMDGLSGGVAAIVASVLAIFAFLKGNFTLGLPALILAGSLFGFLRYNFSPAQIFMGDCGSMFIGFMLATITLQGSWQESAHLVMVSAVPILLLAVPIFDTIFVTIMRGVNSRGIFQGGKDHISHRMVVLGFSERKTVLVLYVISIIFGGISLFSMYVSPLVTVILILLAIIVLLYFAAFLGKVKVYVRENITNIRKKNGKVVLNNMLLHKRRVLEVVADFIFICVAYVAANLLRFEGILSIDNQNLIVRSLPIILIIKYIVFFKFGLYRGIWRYVSVSDFINIFNAVSFASVASVLAILFIWRFQGFSRTVFIIDWLLLFVFICGGRVLERVYKEIFDYARLNGRKVLIYGAGDAGEFTLREIKNNKLLEYKPIGFLDDDEEKFGKKIHGIPVLGSREDLARLSKVYEIDELLLAIPSLPEQILEEIIVVCNSLDVKYRKISDILPRV